MVGDENDNENENIRNRERAPETNNLRQRDREYRKYIANQDIINRTFVVVEATYTFNL